MKSAGARYCSVMVNPWFKMYGLEYLSDPKIQQLNASERSVWITLLCLASASSGVIRYVSGDFLLMRSGIVTESNGRNFGCNIDDILTRFEALDMIEFGSEKRDMIIVKNWQKRQESALTNAERQSRFRAKNRNENVTERVTKVTLDKNRIDKIQGISREIPVMVEERLDREGNPVAPRKKKDNFAKDYDALCDWAENRRGFPFVERGKQYKWLKTAREVEISRERLKNRWMKLEGELWREGKIEWKTVVESFNTEK